jgi:spore coat-associated protein N
MRGLATLITSLAMALAAIGLAVAAPADPRLAAATIQSASGAVTIANSHAGGAIFSAAGLRPGESASGTVRIGNAGDAAGIFALRAPDVQDAPGPYGGRLSEELQLVLVDVTDAPHPVTLFSGHPADLGQLGLGTLAAGEARTYRFSVTLPSAAGNAYQGSGLTLGFEWRAGPAPGVGATPTPTPPAATPAPTTPAPTATPTTPLAPVDYAGALGLPPAKTCVKAGRLKFKLKAPDRAKVVAATIALNGRVTVRIKGAKARKPVTLRGLRKSTIVKVTVQASNGRAYSGARTYRACGKGAR